MTEDRAHRFSPLSSVTSPETVVADTEAMPPPSRPDIDLAPGPLASDRFSNVLTSLPEVDLMLTSASTFSGSLTRMSPDTL